MFLHSQFLTTSFDKKHEARPYLNAVHHLVVTACARDLGSRLLRSLILRRSDLMLIDVFSFPALPFPFRTCTVCIWRSLALRDGDGEVSFCPAESNSAEQGWQPLASIKFNQLQPISVITDISTFGRGLNNWSLCRRYCSRYPRDNRIAIQRARHDCTVKSGGETKRPNHVQITSCCECDAWH